MSPLRFSRANVTRVALVIGVAVTVALPASAAASVPGPTPLFTECPAVGTDTGCAVLITINSNGTAKKVKDPGQPAFNGRSGALIGMVNQSNAVVQKISLSGSGGATVTKPFGFQSHGLCTVTPTPCASPKAFGPTGYEGPGTSFSYDQTGVNGSVSVPGGLAPGASRYFSLDQSPIQITGVKFRSGVSLTGLSITATEGSAVTPTVATFTDGPSTAPPSEFAATIDWGDGSTPGVGSISQPGGSGAPYVVMSGHTFAATGTFTTTISVIDLSLAANAATANGSAVVTGAVVDCSADGCAGSVTSATQEDQVSSTSTTGSITVSLEANDGSINCGDPFRHAPQITDVTDAGLGANIDFTITFNNIDAAGLWYVPFAVCYQSSPAFPFTDYFGNQGVTLGLLPTCGQPLVAPCVQSIVESPNPLGNPQLLGTVVENIVVPPGDPRYR